MLYAGLYEAGRKPGPIIEARRSELHLDVIGLSNARLHKEFLLEVQAIAAL